MKELSIANFKYGLDSRREALTSLLGTLVTCDNAHINPGGEVEKRKMWMDLGDLDLTGTLLTRPIAIAFTETGLLAVTACNPTHVPFPNSKLEARFSLTFQNLEHPAVSDGETYNDGIHLGLRAKFIQVFRGKALVAVEFIDRNTFLYYDGEIVEQSRNGIVLTGLTDIEDLARQFTAQVNAVTDWFAVANVNESGASLLGASIVRSPGGVYFTPTIEVDSDEGLLGANIVDKDGATTAEVKASASFELSRASDGTVELIAPANSDGTGTAALTGGVVSTEPSVAEMAAKVVAAVNDLTVIHGYTALLGGTSTITVYAPIGFGSAINGFNLTVNVTGGMGTGGPVTPPSSMAITAKPNPVNVQILATIGSPSTKKLGRTVVVSASGGTAPYTYAWTNVEDFDTVAYNQASILLRKTLPIGTAFDAVITCTVTDSAANFAVININVHFQYGGV